jgi:sugar phosphate isomerase/epimerase
MLTSRRTFLAIAGAALPLAGKPRFSRPLGLQIYSLRREARKDLPGTLALIRKLGFTELEVGGFYGKTATEFQRMLADYGLKATSMGTEWGPLMKSTKQAIDDASALGAKFVTISQIPRKKRLTLDDTTRAAENFNRWGETLAAAGLRFCYHAHGPEFVSGPDGTLFDTLAKLTDPKLANFEMDVFWFVFGNQDPAKMLERYPRRFPLMHLKDIRHGEPRTFDPGTVEEEASVPLGTGEVDWPPVLKAAKKTAVERYYIEEEHPNAVKQIQQSLVYLEKLEF